MYALDHVELDRLARIHRTGEIARLALSAYRAMRTVFKGTSRRAGGKRPVAAAHWNSRACA